MKNNVPKARKSGLVVQDLNGETLIYDLNTNRAVCLNETSALVWQNCDGVKTVSDISSILSAETNNPASEDLIWLALDQLNKENLIENSTELESKFEGVSRRDVIKKVGLGTMIALPIVTGLVAPMAASANSPGVCTATACSCTGARAADGSCTSTTCNSAVSGCICRGTNGGGNQGTCRTA